MEFIYTSHAMQNIIERRIPKNIIEDCIKNPDSIISSKKSRKIAQKVIGNKLLRIIYKETEKVYIVITVYFTKTGRY